MATSPLRHTPHFAHAAARPTARRPRSRPAQAHVHRPAKLLGRRARLRCAPYQAHPHKQVSGSAQQAEGHPYTQTAAPAWPRPRDLHGPLTRRPHRPRTLPARDVLFDHPFTSMTTSSARLAHIFHFLRRVRPLPERPGHQDSRRWPCWPRRCRGQRSCRRGRLYRCRRG